MHDPIKDKAVFFGAAIAWFAVITQFILMAQVRVEPLLETTLRFFSYFTILTNSLTALYFSVLWYMKPKQLYDSFNKAGFLTAVMLYMLTVGTVYQIVLRGLWEPQGMQRIVDELLHSVLPVYVLLFWLAFENKKAVSPKLVSGWLVYPLVYLICILFRGYASGFYPYPFVDVTQLGIETVLINSGLLLLGFVCVAMVIITLGKLLPTTLK